MGKTDQKSRDRRLLAVRYTYNQMLDGATFSILINNLMDDEYDLGFKYSKSGAEKVVLAARNILREDFENDLPHLKEKILAQYYDIYTEAKNSSQYQSALKALENISKLTGLNEPEKKDVVIRSIDINFGFEEMEPIGFKTEEPEEIVEEEEKIEEIIL